MKTDSMRKKTMRGEKCRLIELFDEELARFESYDNGEAFSIARHRYALERHGISEGRAMVIAHIEPFQGPTPPSREERIEKALSNTTPYLSRDVIVPVAQDDCIERIISYVDEYINDQIDRVVLKSEIGLVIDDIFYSYLQKGG